MRRFIRHPSNIPVELIAARTTPEYQKLNDISLGGLCCDSSSSFAKGDMITIRISLLTPPFETQCRVAWCRTVENGYRVGAEFLHADQVFEARMVEQVCHIENYRGEIAKSGGTIDWEQAATEWIALYGAQFPRL